MKKAVQVGSVVVQRILHVPQRMKGKSLQRFTDSQAYKKEVGKDRRILAQTTQQAIDLINKKESTSGSSPDTTIMAQATRSQKQTKTTPEAPAKKGAAKKAAAKKAAPEKAAPAKKGAAKVEEKGPGKIEQIIALHKKGKSNAEIVEQGFNKTTVSIQVAKYKKENGKGSKK
jgi:hypothetical protein